MLHISKATRAAHCAAVDAVVPVGTAFAPRQPETAAQRLLRLETEFLDAAIERHVHGSGHMRDLSLSIIALRAQITG